MAVEGSSWLRVLVSIAPLSYREALAFSLRNHRPHLEVMITAPDDLDREVERFEPHLVVCNGVTSLVRSNVLSWVAIRFEDGLGALISLDNHTSEVHDIMTEDVLGAIDETERIVSQA